jgi:archaetidylinositol phosphate synthase
MLQKPSMTFPGKVKVGSSILSPLEQRVIRWAVPHIPKWIRSSHLTLMSIPISLAIVGFGFLAKDDNSWLWAISIFIALQWLTDSLDGAVGRWRNEGLVRWGYYMDHFLDYFFLCSILISYSLMLPDHFKFLHFFVLAIFGGFMIHSYLTVTAAEEFRIVHLGIGPTEIRIVFILINTLIFFFGKTYMVSALPFILILAVIGLVHLVYQTQKMIYLKDVADMKKEG